MDTADQKSLSDALLFFWRAYLTADHIEYRRGIGDLRERHLKIIEEVNSLLDREPDLGKVVQGAADALVRIGQYYRVQICLVDPRRECIQAVAHQCVDRENDFNLSTDFPLQDDQPEEEWDIQRWVVLKRETKTVPDASSPTQKRPTTQHDKVRPLGMRGIAVVPMIVQDEVLGTIHFERKDKAEPSSAECDLFKVLAGQLGVAFHQAQRLTLLHESLMRLTDQIWILDPLGRVVFMNDAAKGTASDAQAGFQSRDRMRNAETWRLSSADVPAELLKDTEGLADATHHYIIDREKRTARDLLTAAILDFRGQLRDHLEANGRIGSVHRLHDLTALFELYDTLQDWLADTDVRATARKILEFFRSKGYSWCRLYLHHKSGDQEWLQSLEQFGLSDLKNRERFAAGELRFYKDKDPLPWYVLLSAMEPAVYEFRSDHSEDQPPSSAPPFEGKPCYWTKDSRYRETLEKTAFRWIEAPLRVGNQNVGIISLSMPAKLLPQDWELLKSALLAVSMAIYNAQRTQNMTDFISKMNHDIRTPLSWILSYAEELVHHTVQGEMKHPVAAKILQHTKDLTHLINDLLDFGWIKARRHTRAEIPYDLRQMLHDLQANVEPRARHKGLDVGCTIEPLVPQFIRGDRLKLRTVLTGLLENAVKFTDQGKVEMSVDVQEHFLVFTVQDTGVGIPSDELNRIFEMFGRGHPTEASVPGYGVGLANCRDLVHIMGGEISPDSELGKGSRFTVRLPLVRANTSEVQDPLRQRRAVCLQQENPEYRILVVDDLEESREIWRNKLTRLGFDVREAHDGASALQVWRGWIPHVVFMDITMPGMTGQEATSRIKLEDTNDQTMIVALTANRTMLSERSNLRKEGFVDVLSEPVEEFEVVRWLETHLGVSFNYEDVDLPPTGAQVRQLLSRDSFASLSDKLREELKTAAEDGEYERVQKAIELIKHTDRVLAERLFVLLNAYDFDYLQQILT